MVEEASTGTHPPVVILAPPSSALIPVHRGQTSPPTPGNVDRFEIMPCSLYVFVACGRRPWWIAPLGTAA